MPPEKDFDNKRVVIVGGSSGIGLAVAEKVALLGAEVVIVSSNAQRVQAGIEVATVRALDGSSRIVFREEDGLHFSGFQRPEDAAETGDTAPVGLGEIHRFAGFGRGAMLDPLLKQSAGAIANLFIGDAGNIG